MFLTMAIDLTFWQMAKNAAAGRTPSSMPMPTPPPASLNISSPDFAPLSPVNTNPLSDAKMNVKSEPTNFNLPPSYSEENRAANALTSRVLSSDYNFGDQRNDKFMTGGMVIFIYYFNCQFKRKDIDLERLLMNCSNKWDIGCNQREDEEHAISSCCRKYRIWH